LVGKPSIDNFANTLNNSKNFPRTINCHFNSAEQNTFRLADRETRNQRNIHDTNIIGKQKSFCTLKYLRVSSELFILNFSFAS